MSRNAAEPSVPLDELLASDTRYGDASISIITDYCPHGFNNLELPASPDTRPFGKIGDWLQPASSRSITVLYGS
jgi:hypothetical protein